MMPHSHFRRQLLLAVTMLLCVASLATVYAQASKSTLKYDTTLYNKMQWREVGPFQGGRSIAVAGHRDQPYTYYFGATGGGIWKTDDGGDTWLNVSDAFLKVGIVGALAVAESDPNVIYAGTGESCIRGNTMPGEGMYKSVDAGKTWNFIGLGEAQTISEIAVHPKDADLVYAAVFGHVFGPNPERGVYRSKDGGKTWQKVLYVNEKTAACDLVLDPLNPRVLYAGMWEANRTPWNMTSGGPGSGLWKSTDGGDTWTNLSSNRGIPRGVKGKICIAASGAKADLVWAMIEADGGGLFRSDDAGKSWRRVNEDQRIRQRAWYYSHVYADPKNPEAVYLLNTGFYRSIDGGRTLANIGVPHGDNHDLWIDPNNPQRMIEANDGSVNVSYNGGKTWSDQEIPTGQFYHVLLDNQFPYYIYGSQQDNSTVAIPSRTTGGSIGKSDWFDVGGGESGYIAVNPKKPSVIYAGNYGGYLTRFDRRTDQTEDINAWPDNPMGGGADSMKYRFQWTYPIVSSPHDPNVLYITGNVVFKSANEGKSWDIISPDLTRNDKSKEVSSGGPITKDNTGTEYYCTIFAFAESPVQQGILWAGSDDGLIHVSTDAGAHWNNVTPKDLPEWSRISLIDPSPHEAGTAYVAAKRYEQDDFRPFIYKTSDFGKTWKRIVKGIPENEFVHAVREDPNRKGMLYAGTERGVYISFDDGENWQSLQLNLPVVPVHDLMIQARDKDLVAATHGRAFWVLDDLTPLYQLADAGKNSTYLYQPRLTYRMRGFGGFGRAGSKVGKNPANGAVVYYYLKNKPKDELKLEFFDKQGKLVKAISSREEQRDGETPPPEGDEESPFGRRGGAQRIPTDSGMNRFVWDLRYTDATTVPGALLWGGTTRGPVIVPGTYSVLLIAGKDTIRQSFDVKLDPRVETSQEDLQEQLGFLLKIRDKLSSIDETINTIRDIKKQIDDVSKRSQSLPSRSTIRDAVKTLTEKLSSVEEELIQVKIKSSQDALNFPIKLNNKIAAVASSVGSADTRPTKQQYDVFAELSAKAEIQLEKAKAIVSTDVPAFNKLVKEQDVPAVILKSEGREQRRRRE
jgi:photosystem II stability/assembly factor-like uncharacterized protein